jgi:hypothetical protein
VEDDGQSERGREEQGMFIYGVEGSFQAQKKLHDHGCLANISLVSFHNGAYASRTDESCGV